MRDELVFLHGGTSARCIATVDKRFDYHTVQLLTAGAVELYYDDQRFVLSDAALWPCYPGPYIRFHEWPRGHAWHHHYIAVTGPRVDAWVADGMWPTVPLPLDSGRADGFAEVLDEVVALSREPDRWPRRRAGNLLERLLLDWAQVARTPAPERPTWLDAVLARLADTTAEPDYRDLAACANVSLSTLRRRFRESVGASLHDYRLECRTARARTLLGETDRPIKAIAAELGYCDVFYFTRQFKQLSGVTPAAYRRSRQS